MIWLGLFLLGFVAHQLWITDFFAERHQAVLAEERDEYFATAEIVEVPYTPGSSAPPTTLPSDPGATTTTTVADPSSGDAPLLLRVEQPPERSQAFAEIRIPEIEVEWTVVEGVRLADLKNGAGHMPDTPLPGQPGNAVISGHRTTYGAPFHDLDKLESGALIEVETGLGTHVYEVTEWIIVEPTALWVTDPREGAWLTLTTCHPKFSARQRLVLFAQLVAGPNAEVILGSA
jgi:sortase A